MSEQSQGSLWVPVAVLILAVISIQVGSSIAISLFGKVGPEGLIALRLLFSTLMFMVLFKPWRVKIRGGEWRSLLLYGVALGAMSFTLYQSFKYIDQAIAIALEFIGPLAVTIYYSRRRIDLLWVALVILGLYGLILHGYITQEGVEMPDLRGVLWALSTGFFWGAYIIFGKRAGKSYGINTVAIGSIIATLIFFPVGVMVEGMNLFTPEVIAIGLMIALLSSAIPYGFEMYALNRMPTQTFGILTSAEPLFGALSGTIILHQILTPAEWIGLSLIIFASAGAILFAKEA